MNNKQKENLFWTFFVILAIVELFITTQMEPVFDDLPYLTAPCERNISECLLPYYSWWRPFDALTGYFLEFHKSWFPMFNHIVVWAFHVLSAITLYAIMRLFGLKKESVWIGTIMFMISPAMLGTLYDTDSINQTGALFFDLLGLYAYISSSKKKHIILWIIFTLIATFFKENGITWFVVTPLLTYAWLNANRIQTRNMVITGLVCAAGYMVIRLMLPHYGEINPDYYSYPLFENIKKIGKIIFIVFIPIDNVSLLHDNSHLLALISLLLTMPFLGFIIYKNRRNLITSKVIITLICLFIAISPHLLLLFTIMHAYGTLPFTTLIFTLFIQNIEHNKSFYVLLIVFFAGLLEIDIHHSIEKYKSGKYMVQLGEQAISIIHNQPQFKHKVPNKVYSISIKDDYKKYSTFCLGANDAFCWGYSVQFVNHFTWPKVWEDTCIDYRTNITKNVNNIAQRAYKKGFEIVLKVDKNGVHLCKNPQNIHKAPSNK